MAENRKYGLHGCLTAQKGKGGELADILLEAARLMNSAEGCHLYLIGINPDMNEEIWITEVWESRQHHDDSLQFPGVRELIGKAMPLLAVSPKKGQEWEIIGGKGFN